MARTLSGGFVGRAAQLEAQDQREAMQLSTLGFKAQVMETAQKVSDLAGASLYNAIWTAAPANDRAFYEHMKQAHTWLLLLSRAELETARELAKVGFDFAQIQRAIETNAMTAQVMETYASL